MFGDSLFAFGAIVLGRFVLGLVTGHSFDKKEFKKEPVIADSKALGVARAGD